MAMNEWKNIIMLFKSPIHVLFCSVGHKTYVLLSRFPLLFWSEWSKITSIFGSYRFLRIAWHDIFSLSHHLLASWNLYIPRVAEWKSKCSSSRQVKHLDESKALELKSNAQVNNRTPSCLKFGKTSNRAVENLPQRNSESGQLPTRH